MECFALSLRSWTWVPSCMLCHQRCYARCLRMAPVKQVTIECVVFDGAFERTAVVYSVGQRHQRDKRGDTIPVFEQCRNCSAMCADNCSASRAEIVAPCVPTRRETNDTGRASSCGGLCRGGAVSMLECLRMMPGDVVRVRCGSPPSSPPFAVLFLTVWPSLATMGENPH